MSSTKKANASKVPAGGKAKTAAPVKSPAKPSAKAVSKSVAAKAGPIKSGVTKTVAAAKPAKAAVTGPLKSKTTAKAVIGKRPAAAATPKLVQAPQLLPRSLVRAAHQNPEKKLTARSHAQPIVLTPDYRPSENEPFMNEMHRAYFRQKLMTWKDEIIRQTKETLVILHEDSVQHADIADRATSETDRSLELRARDRQRKLIAKIDAALSRIEDGSYGYCEETGEPIGLKRLDARPIATLSLEAQERHERREKVYRED